MNILKLSYCGRLSFGKRKKFKPDPVLRSKQSPWQTYMALVIAQHGVAEALRLVRTLPLSSVSNLQKTLGSPSRARRGLKGISSPARLKVKSACDYLQERYGRSRLSFLTLTVPPECLNPQLLGDWSNLSRKLRQWLVYHLQQSDLDGEIVGVTEIQEGRQEEGGLPCLHWHLVFVGKRHGESWAIDKSEVRGYWCKLLSESSGVQCRESVRTEIESVRKSASGYLGKYISKGSKALKRCDQRYLPSSWYLITRSLSRKIDSLTIRVEGQQAEYLYDYYQENRHLFRFSRFVDIKAGDGSLYTLGWYADLQNRQVYHQVKQELIAYKRLVKPC